MNTNTTALPDAVALDLEAADRFDAEAGAACFTFEATVTSALLKSTRSFSPNHKTLQRIKSMKTPQRIKHALTLIAKRFSIKVATIALALVTAIFSTGCATASKQATAGKYYHVGLVWLKEPGNAEHRQKIIAAAHSFAREIPEVKFLSVGQTLPKASEFVDASFDICFVMRLEDKAALERYSKSPIHAKAAQEVFRPLSSKFLFYDFLSE